MDKRSLVSVVDDDESVRESLPDLLREFGFAAQAFSSAEEFLASDVVGQTRCLILDIAMPGMSRTRSPTGIEASPARDSDRLHHRPRRRDRPSAPARTGCRGVPVQAVQRYGAAGGAQCRTSSELSVRCELG